MSTRRATIDDSSAALAPAGRVVIRPMFGEYAVYLDDKLVGLVCDDQLFLKPTAAGRAELPAAADAPPYPGARPHFRVPAAVVAADPDMVRRAVRATPDALPAAEPKKPKPAG